MGVRGEIYPRALGVRREIHSRGGIAATVVRTAAVATVVVRTGSREVQREAAASRPDRQGPATVGVRPDGEPVGLGGLAAADTHQNQRTEHYPDFQLDHLLIRLGRKFLPRKAIAVYPKNRKKSSPEPEFCSSRTRFRAQTPRKRRSHNAALRR